MRLLQACGLRNDVMGGLLFLWIMTWMDRPMRMVKTSVTRRPLVVLSAGMADGETDGSAAVLNENTGLLSPGTGSSGVTCQK